MIDEKNLEYQKAIAQLDAKIAQESTKTSTVGYLFWSFLIPPFTILLVMYFAWKKGVLHLLMPNITVAYSILFVLWSLLMFSAPGAFSDYLHQPVAGVATLDKIEAIFLVAFGIAGGIYFRIKAKKEGGLSLVYVGLATLILVLQFFAAVHQLSFISGVVNSAQDVNLGL